MKETFFRAYLLAPGYLNVTSLRIPNCQHSRLRSRTHSPEFDFERSSTTSFLVDLWKRACSIRHLILDSTCGVHVADGLEDLFQGHVLLVHGVDVGRETLCGTLHEAQR